MRDRATMATQQKLLTILDTYPKEIQELKKRFFNLNDDKYSIRKDIASKQYALDHIKGQMPYVKYVIDILDVDGLYYASQGTVKQLIELRVFQYDLNSKYNIQTNFNSFDIQLLIDGHLHKYCIVGQIQRYLQYQKRNSIHVWFQYITGMNHTSPQFESAKAKIQEYLQALEFNVKPFESDMTKLQKKLTDITKIAEEAQVELKSAKEHIRVLELEVHYLKSCTGAKVKVDYEFIKQKNKHLNAEFRRIYKLCRRSL